MGVVWGCGVSSLLARRAGLGRGPDLDYWQTLLDDNPGRLYKLDDTAGVQVTDYSGNDQHGTYFNTPTLGASSCIPTVDDEAVEFDDASSEYATINWHASTQLTAEITFVPHDPTAVANQFILAQGNYLVDFRWSLWLEGTSGIIKGSALTENSGQIYVTGPASTQDAAHHVVMRYEPNVALSLFVNGSLVDTEDATGAGDIDTAAGPTSVAVVDNSSLYFDGKIQGIALWDAPLTDNRILRHFRAAGYST